MFTIKHTHNKTESSILTYEPIISHIYPNVKNINTVFGLLEKTLRNVPIKKNTIPIVISIIFLLPRILSIRL